MNCPLGSRYKVAAGTAMQTLALGLMAGGMLAIGAFAAPAVFRAFPRHEAGAALVGVFIKYDFLLLISLGLVVLGEGLRLMGRVFAVKHPVSILRYVLMVALAGMLIYSTQVVNPGIEAMHRAGVHVDASAEGLRFLQTHKLSENLYKAEMMTAALLILLTPFVPLSAKQD